MSEGKTEDSRLVVFDTSVLFPPSLRDLLLRLSKAEIIRPRWTDHILEELTRNLIRDVHMRPEMAQRLIRTLDIEFPSARVSNYDKALPLARNYPSDQHVLAAAITSGATGIVTLNLRHFPSYALEPHGIKVMSPDDC